MILKGLHNNTNAYKTEMVPPKILLHKDNTKGLKVFLWIS